MANDAKLKAFADMLKKINNMSHLKSETGTLIARMGDEFPAIKTISTGSLVLDSILGGGLPVGRLIEVFGPEASGKTSIALTAAANVQREGGTVAFVDLEQALDPVYAKKLGVDVPNMALAQPDSAEQALDLIDTLAASGVVDLIVVDSIAALVPKAELEGTMEQQTMAVVARLMSRSLKKLIGTANRSKTTVIFINQQRDNIGGFSPVGVPQTTSGGKAMKYYASQRIEVKRRGQVKDGKDIIGNEIKLKVVKNKVAAPFGEGTTILTFNRGINRAAEMVEVAKDYPDVIRMPNNRTYMEAETGEVFAKSKAEALEKMENDQELYNRLAERLSKVIKDELFDGKSASSEEGEDIQLSDEDDLDED
jgi:recombination protein RecA